MLSDWLLILAALSPAFLALVILFLILLGRVARHANPRVVPIRVNQGSHMR
jgi:hypothetical protein